MTTIQFETPWHITDRYTVYTDITIWQATNYTQCQDYSHTPARCREPGLTLGNCLRRNGAGADELDKQYGLYLVAFCFPSPALYVGIAGYESVKKRISKHRIKATGSHIGRDCYHNGGVNHTRRWREFAQSRYLCYSRTKANVADGCSDMRVCVGHLLNGNGAREDHPDPDILKFFENQILKNSCLYNHICALLWPQLCGLPFRLNSDTGTPGERPAAPNIKLWDQTDFVL